MVQRIHRGLWAAWTAHRSHLVGVARVGDSSRVKRQNTMQQKPRLFQLVRHTDVAGVRGTGTLAEGVEWSDGAVTLRWRGRWPATSVWDGGIDALLAVHGHNGRTQIHWLLPTTQESSSRQLARQQTAPAPTAPAQRVPELTGSAQRAPELTGPAQRVPERVGTLWLPAAGADGLCGRCGRGWPCLGCGP